MSAERRASFRFLVRPELKTARLSWRGQSLTVELIDQSATGFSFKAPKDVEIKLNEVVSFRSWAGDCEALVVRLAENRDSLRVGIERTSDLVAPDSRRRWLPAWITAKAPLDLGAAPDGRAHVRLAAAILVLGVVTVTTCLAARDKKSPPPQIDSNEPVAELATKPEPVEPAAEAANEAPSGVPSSEATQASLEKLGSLRRQKTAESLELSEGQKLEVSRLLSELSDNLSRLRPANTVKRRAARAARIGALLTAAHDRVAQILTTEQMARWRSEP